MTLMKATAHMVCPGILGKWEADLQPGNDERQQDQRSYEPQKRSDACIDFISLTCLVLQSHL